MKCGVERLWVWTLVPTRSVVLHNCEAAPFHRGLNCTVQKEQVQKNPSSGLVAGLGTVEQHTG